MIRVRTLLDAADLLGLLGEQIGALEDAEVHDAGPQTAHGEALERALLTDDREPQ